MQQTKTLNNQGFALIATISIMVLLVIISIAMLNLSTVESSSTSQKENIQRARANARLALMTAISQLQKMAGPDTRVTAPADAVANGDINAPRQLTGVWRSWEGNDHNKTTGLPIAPTYADKLIKGDITDSTVDGRFLGWLISTPEQDNDANSPPNLTETTTTVPLLAEGSLGTSATDLEVHLVPTPIESSGSIAYWIQGENTKAHLRQKDTAAPTDHAEWSQRLAANGLANAESFGFDTPSQLSSSISLDTMDLLSNSSGSFIPSQDYLNITTVAKGLLTNTANGGWRRDLSLMAETWSNGSLAITGLPVFTAEPYAVEIESSLRLDNNPSNGAIYPWVTEDNVAMSWNALMDFTSLYKKVKKNTLTNEPYFDPTPINNSEWTSIMPILARVHWAFGYDATRTAINTDTDGDGDIDTDDEPYEYTPYFLLKPAITIWNPYNVAIEAQNVMSLVHMPDTSFPVNLYVTIGTQPEVEIDMGALIGNRVTSNQARLQTNASTSDDPTWKPGESRIYGKPGLSTTTTNWNWLSMTPGFSIDGNLTLALSNGGSVVTGYGDDQFSYRWDHKQNSSGNVNASFQYFWSRSSALTDPEGNNYRNLSCRYNFNTPFATANEKFPLPSLTNDDETLESAYTDDSPFLVVSIGLRTLTNEDSSPTPLNKVYTKGYIDTKPIIPGIATLGGITVEDSPYTWEIFAPNEWNDAFMPQADDTVSYGDDQSSFIASSFQSSFGLNRWVIAELPTQPLLSLCELQHFDISFRNNYRPRVANAIGNSHASAYLAPDEVQVDSSFGSTIGYDHSYVSNHIFFDDWFFSSITPEYEAFTQTENRSIEEVYADHLSQEASLRNSQYLPASPLNPSTALIQSSATLADNLIWHDIASEIEVEGMFNINSTSITAWKALLMNQRDTQVPVTTMGAATADDWETTLNSSSEIPVTRTTVAGDPNSASDPSIALIATHLNMNDSEIEALATAIVNQVKKRGPFLSLSEFVNRQIRSDDNELALAGTIEAALIELSKNTTDNPFEHVQSAYPEQAVLPSDATTIYQFPEAAEGYAAYGTPGWARQADILRPLAPIISARDDTFRIRAYGEVKDPTTGEVAARSWCEAIVQRKANYVDSADDATERVSLSNTNKQFGRKFEIISFRWLSSDEV